MRLVDETLDTFDLSILQVDLSLPLELPCSKPACFAQQGVELDL